MVDVFCFPGMFACYLFTCHVLTSFHGVFPSYPFLYFSLGISLGIIWFFFRPTYLSCIVMGVFVLGFDVINAWDDIKSYFSSLSFLFLILVFLPVCVSVCLSLLWVLECLLGMGYRGFTILQREKSALPPTGKTSVGRTLSFYTNNLTVETNFVNIFQPCLLAILNSLDCQYMMGDPPKVSDITLYTCHAPSWV